ncbi:MAG: DUF805 domain-containing protein [Sphingomonadales bacterium]|nr:DUF805 domain-containing protein [Sphingomonadales bacterium]
MDHFRRVGFWSLLGQVVRRSLDFRCRATRAELAVGVIAALVFVPLAGMLASLAPFPDTVWSTPLIEAVSVVPLPALLVRRLHDHDRRGWWMLPAVFAFALAMSRSAVAASQGIEARIALDRVIWPLDWLAIVGNIAMVALLVLPGTPGENRFGPNPRTGA